jgi:hypothetical protein
VALLLVELQPLQPLQWVRLVRWLSPSRLGVL